MTFTIIESTGSMPIIGTFMNLPDGGTITAGNNTFQATTKAATVTISHSRSCRSKSATTQSVSLCVRMKSRLRLWNRKRRFARRVLTLSVGRAVSRRAKFVGRSPQEFHLTFFRRETATTGSLVLENMKTLTVYENKFHFSIHGR